MFAIRYKTIFYMWFVIAGLTLGGCSTTDLEIARVDKNLDEGRLLPTDALDTTDVLNQYSHDYPPPNAKNMAIYIDVDRKKLFTQGGEVYMQLALATRPATPAPVHMHVLVYDEHVASSEHLNFQNEIIESLYKADQAFHTGSTFSLDTSANTNSRQTKYPALLAAHATTLKDFLGAYTSTPLPSKGHEYVLLLGDVGNISASDKQDMVDMAKVFSAMGVKFSVLSYGEKPDFAFLSSLVESGHGTLSFRNDYFNKPDWVNNELNHVHAVSLQDIQISLHTKKGVRIEEVVSPKNTIHQNESCELKIPAILSGEQYVMLVRLSSLPMQDQEYRDLVEVNIQYYEPLSDKYTLLNAKYRIDYSMDRNETKPLRKGRIARSKIILATYDTLTGVPQSVSANRNYKAMADLTAQVSALENFMQGNTDKELTRDVGILRKYAAHLHDFDESWFKGWKKWKDMYLDTDRFSHQYN